MTVVLAEIRGLEISHRLILTHANSRCACRVITIKNSCHT